MPPVRLSDTRRPGRPLPAGPAAPDTQEELHEDRLRLLLEVLAQVTDPRDRRGRVHPLPFVLALAVLAVTAGARTSLEIAEQSADLDQRVLRVLGWRRWSGTPSRWTFDRVLARIDDAELDRVLSWWSSPGRQAAVDGKTMRAAATGQSSMPLTQVVAATGANGSVLGQAQVVGGSENAAALDLIARLGPERLSGAVLTADAKHTSARFVAAAGAVEAFWLLPVKHNSPALHRKLAERPWGRSVRPGQTSGTQGHLAP
ncbi:ISAs1 family transposase [Streptomyces sp. NBC_00846]|uniref:ISAs1 family transposase n=1 Tax=Streptomyces sp. NBC_00846 TaxID=2975849 RepID=UPI0038676D28|nr:ISAs1 family transposase [Streptomyces sp. NBC_00846]